MTATREAEATLLRSVADDLQAEGYTVIIEPTPDALPGSLKGLRPDAVAIGRDPKLVIEIAKEGRESLARVQKLREAVRAHDGWALRLIYDRSASTEQLTSLPLAAIEETLASAAAVSKQDTRASLILYWASSEAIARLIDKDEFARPQTPGRIVERLAAKAYIVPSEAEFLREMARKRNAFVHGQLSVDVTSAEIASFGELLTSLVSAARSQGLG